LNLVDPFQVVKNFDGGGLGELLHCRDARGVDFAVKLPKDRSLESQRLIDDEERRFIRHQGQFVVRYYGQVRHQDGRRGFAMELMAGSLSGLVSQRGALDAQKALGYFQQVVSGLEEVHASAPGAFHGDIKLANILYRVGAAKLADFGLARGGFGQTRMLGPHLGGTPGYFPPERLASQRGDVYSAGVLLWALLAGREPHPEHGPNVTLMLEPTLARLVNGMLEREPQRRLTIYQVKQMLPAAMAANAVKEDGVPGWLVAGFGVLALTLLMGAKGK